MKKFALILPFWPLLLMGVALFVFCRTPGFGVHKVSSNFPYHAEWDVSGLDDTLVDPIFSQTFHYIGNGAQCFAFESRDGKYVLKLFKMKHLTQSSLGKLLPLERYKEKDKRHALRLSETFAACKMAFEELKEETGLVYVHINPTQHLKRWVKLLDKEGNHYQIDLDKTVFLVQEKAEMVYKRIGHLIKAGDHAGAKAALASVIDLISLRNSKGFVDNDTGISRNYGFVGGRPIHLDFLQIVKAENPNEREKIETKMRAWIEKHYPGEL